MDTSILKENEILFSRPGEVISVTAVGEGCIRFRASANGHISDEDWNLMPQAAEASVVETEDGVTLTTGDLSLTIDPKGKVTVTKKGKCILEEHRAQPWDWEYRHYHNIGSQLWKARVCFKPNPGEHLYGLGHGPNGVFDMKGCSVELENLNTRCSIPFLYSSLGYGFLWNNPSVGTCNCCNNKTEWIASCTRQIDYVILSGDPKEVATKLADLTGHSPMLPHWASGFWQSRMRYESQEQLMEVARSYVERGIPLSCIIVDYFHWTEHGDYRFDPQYWPDPKAMADELHEMGIKLMVSVWPTINEQSENYAEMNRRNLLTRTTRGRNIVHEFMGANTYIDTTNPETRAFVWEKLRKNYIEHGVDNFWFDAAEPEYFPSQWDNLIFSKGNGDEVGLLYPYYYAQMVHDGMKSIGKADETVTLTRAAWLGSQRYATAVWSGDIPSTFESLSEQIKSGLNMAVCGIPWWNTDIGGFLNGDIQSDYFRELIVRWFQYGVFSPIMRLHGVRNRIAPPTPGIKEPTGGPNELWSFGEENYEILKELVLLRERLRPYIEQHMQEAADKGYPIMRPMFFEYPEDENCYLTGEQYMFGSGILFAPISGQGQTEKEVYLPAGKWVHTKTRQVYDGDRTVTIHAEVRDFVAFTKLGDPVIDLF